MNKPKKSLKTEILLTSFLNLQFKKHFYKIYIHDQRSAEGSGPKLYVMNHSNWWDGLLIFYLNRKVMKEDSYAMMSKKGMTDFPFFGKIGAFAVDPASPKDLMRSLKTSLSLLEENKSVWIFPQGKEEHIEKRPFTYMNGPAYLAERISNLKIIPIAAYYTFRHDQRPELFIRIGHTVPPDRFSGLNRGEITNDLRVIHEELVSSVREDIINEQTDQYTLFKSGSKTASEWLQWMKSPLHKRSIK
ncbi:glycerol acyltransferase [Jeotgalibacillus sp. S-D1]|uniref:lysophospholipid acyltransferase family protein n=1 Tax=Jeotgalibacillus sp. S-D1 TaxID=2552189 RepID=UPI00105A44D7|nr:lysophospholipid acyltransferase family protein [Jeotgalibacillus sp. S-D1]TDL34823.1 glycerol acyltransferase [Jeotgalibacillus sp. S-D1]